MRGRRPGAKQEFLGLSERRTQALNRVLQEAGIFVMRDDPQGRRYGYRDPKTGRITKAFGFDLSLLMERHEEFKKIAADAQIERNRMKKLRQQKTLARKAIAQAAEELDTQGYDSEPFRRLLQEAAELVKAGSECGRSDELALAVKASGAPQGRDPADAEGPHQTCRKDAHGCRKRHPQYIYNPNR